MNLLNIKCFLRKITSCLMIWNMVTKIFYWRESRDFIRVVYLCSIEKNVKPLLDDFNELSVLT